MSQGPVAVPLFRLSNAKDSLYEDLYDLVTFIPSLHLPSSTPSSSSDVNIALCPPPSQYSLWQRSVNAEASKEGKDGESKVTAALATRPQLQPARAPSVSHWMNVWPIRYFMTNRQCAKAVSRKTQCKQIKESQEGGGVEQNVPLEISLFMSCWVADMQRRKTIDVSTVNNLLQTLSSMSDALASLERILTTPIPWSYNAHIWEVTYLYCLLLPFQLYGSGFGWITIPAVMVRISQSSIFD